MKRSRKQVHHGGIGRNINIIACLLISIYNTYDLITLNDPIELYFLYLAPFLVIILCLLFIKSRYVNYYIYMVVGLLSIALDHSHSGSSGLIYIFFAYSEIRTSKSLLLLLFVSYVSLSIRFILLDVSGIDIVTPVFVFLFIMATFYCNVILPFKNKGIKQPNLSERERNILKLYTRGYSYEQINHELRLNIDKHSIRKIITRVRDQSGCVNDIQFGKWLYEKG